MESCKHCGGPVLLDASECNGCWELRKHVERDPAMAKKFLPVTSIVLTQADFALLVQGKEFNGQGVRMILSDIGFDRMHDEIHKAEVGL